MGTLHTPREDISDFYCVPARIQEFLESPGADLNEQDDVGDTLLHECIISYYFVGRTHISTYEQQENNNNLVAIIRMLLEAGANPNIRNTKAQTPLHLLFHLCSLYFGTDSFEIVTLFLEHGADPNLVLPTELHSHPKFADFVLSLVHCRVLRMHQLRYRGASEFQENMSECIRMLSLIKMYGGDLNIRNLKHQTILAALFVSPASFPADGTVAPRRNEGMTPFDYKIITSLLQAFPDSLDINMQDEKGDTIMHYLVAKILYRGDNCPGILDCISMILRRNDYDITIRNGNNLAVRDEMRIMHNVNLARNWPPPPPITAPGPGGGSPLVGGPEGVVGRSIYTPYDTLLTLVDEFEKRMHLRVHAFMMGMIPTPPHQLPETHFVLGDLDEDCLRMILHNMLL